MRFCQNWLVFVTLFCAISQIAQAKLEPLRSIPLIGELRAYEYRLTNGLNVFITPNPRAPLVSVYHWVKAGSLHEKPGVTGIAHLFEHMMFRPIRKGEVGFFDHLGKLGGTANANTRFMATVYTSSVPVAGLAQLLRLESQRFQELKVDKDLLDVERKAVWSEYSSKFDSNPIIDLWYTIYQRAFPGHPYGWTVIGERGDLEKITAEDCNEYFAKYYRPNNTGLFISGDVNKEQVIEWIENYYGKWEKGVDSSTPPEFKYDGKSIVAEGRLPGEARNLLIGFRFPEYAPDNQQFMNLAIAMLTSSGYSLGQRRLVNDLKLASLASDFNNDYDSGMLKLFLVLLPQSNTQQVIKEILNFPEFISKMDDDAFKAYLNDFIIHTHETSLRNESLNENMALSWGKWGNIDYFSKILNKDFYVRRDEFVNFLKKYIREDNLIAVSSREKTK